MLIRTGPGEWRTADGDYRVAYRPGAHDDYQLTQVATPNRWSIAATLDEAQRRINGHRASAGRNWNPTR